MSDAQTISFKVLMDPAQAEQAQKTLNLSFDSLLQAVKKLDDTMIKMDRSLVVIGASMSKLHTPTKTTREEIDKSTTSQKGFKDTVDKTTASVDKLGKSINRAGMANTNFNRVIQDSPYFFQSFSMGVMAIGNNLDPLMRSFKDLRDETGSWKGAMKSFVGSFTGGGGLLSVVSLAVSGFTALSLIMRESKDETEKATEKVKGLADAYKDLTREQLKYELLDTQKQLRDLEAKYPASNKTLPSFNLSRAFGGYSPVYFEQVDDNSRFGSDADKVKALKEQVALIQREIFYKGDLDEVDIRLAANAQKRKDLNKDNFDIIVSGAKSLKNAYEILDQWDKSDKEMKKRLSGDDMGAGKRAKKLIDAYAQELANVRTDFNFTNDADEKFLKVQADFIEKVKDQFERNGIKWDAAAREYAFVLSMQLKPKPIDERDMSFIKAFEQANPWAGIDGLSGSYDDNINNLRNQVIKDNPVFKEIADSFGNTLADAGMGAFDKIFDEANSLLEKFLVNFANGLLNVAANNLSKNVFGELLKLLPGGSILSSLFGSGTAPITNKIILDGKVIAEQTVTPSTVNRALNQTQRLRLEY